MTAPAATTAERVLVLMPTQRDAERAVAFLAEAGVQGVICVDLASLCREFRGGAGAVLLSDDAFSLDGAGQLAETIRAQPSWSSMPIIVIAREGWSKLGPGRSPAQESLIIVERPARTRTLVEVVASALRARRHQYQLRDELELRERQAQALKAQDERLQFALAAGKLGSWELNLDTGEMHCSDICRQNLGYATGEPVSYEAFQRSIHPLDRSRVAAAIETCLAEHGECDVEYRVSWPSGEPHWVLMRGRAMYDGSGRPRRMAGVSLDVSERKRLYDALQQSESALARQAEELRLGARRKDEFLATLAHELRNPLAPIRSGLELLARSPDAEAAARALGVMGRQIGHMVRLIDDLLDVSRITIGKLHLQRRRVELRAIVEAAVEASGPLIERKKQTLSVAVPDPALSVYADLTRLAQVIGNLLNNASNYTAEGGLIQLSARQDGAWLVVEVHDNGLGIPDERLGDVFNLFSQINAEPERAQGGLGIGLALVRSLVEMHGGTARAQSPGPGRGSTFTIRVPLAEPAEEVPAAPAALTHSRRGATKRLLVVDDNEDGAEMLALVLGQSGYQIKTVYDGRGALTAADEWQPEVIILDIGLPDINGYDVARELRSRQRLDGLGLIALTGWGTSDDKQKAMEAGFDLHLTKPVDAGELQRALSELEQRGRSQPPSQPLAG